MTGADDESDRARKRAYREFVRTHHPDVGGDPERFAEGLESLRRQETGHSGDADRFDAPIVGVARPTGLRGVAARLRRWQSRRRRPPRVH